MTQRGLWENSVSRRFVSHDSGMKNVGDSKKIGSVCSIQTIIYFRSRCRQYGTRNSDKRCDKEWCVWSDESECVHYWVPEAWIGTTMKIRSTLPKKVDRYIYAEIPLHPLNQNCARLLGEWWSMKCTVWRIWTYHVLKTVSAEEVSKALSPKQDFRDGFLLQCRPANVQIQVWDRTFDSRFCFSCKELVTKNIYHTSVEYAFHCEPFSTFLATICRVYVVHFMWLMQQLILF